MRRRRFLGGAVLLGASGIVGCLDRNDARDRPSTGEPSETARPTVSVPPEENTSRPSPTEEPPTEDPWTEEPSTDRTASVGTLEHAWRSYAHDAANSGHTSVAGPAGPVGEAWSVGGAKAVFTTPAVADGRVVYGAANGRVYSVDAVAGTREWTFETGDYVSSSPSIVDGTVYVGSGDGNVYAVDAASGAERWRRETRTTITGGVAVDDGIVVGAGRHGVQSSLVFGWDAEKGSVAWKHEVGGWITTASAIADGTAYAATSSGMVYAFELATGSELWSVTGPASEPDHYTAPAVVDGTVYVLMRDVRRDTGSRLYSIEASSGEVEWTVGIDGPNLPDNLAVADRSVYTISSSTRQCESDSGMPCAVTEAIVTAVDAASGERRWRRRWEINPEAGPTVDDERLYFVADGRVLAIDRRDGTERWAYDLGEFGRQPPAVSDGVLFVGSSDGSVRAIAEV